MLAKAVKIIGRIFFRPGRSVSFFSVDDNGFSFVHDLRNDYSSETGNGFSIIRPSKCAGSGRNLLATSRDAISRG